MQTAKDFHPVHACNDGLFNSASGKRINLLKPTPDAICIEDIACALSKICRFGGQTQTFYSVAQHSVLVAAMAPDHLKRPALLRDAAEAYLGDVIKPLKVLLGASYSDIERRFEKAIARCFGFDYLEFSAPEIKSIDHEVLELEHWALQCGDILPLVATLHKYEVAMETDHFWAFNPNPAHNIFMGAYAKYFKS